LPRSSAQGAKVTSHGAFKTGFDLASPSEDKPIYACGCRDVLWRTVPGDLFDAANAEGMFLTSTSLCIAGVRSFNGANVGDGRAPGPITKRLTDTYIAEVGCDFVKQYLDRLS
jgi:hypothetical protein